LGGKEIDMELTRPAMSMRTSLLRIGMLITLAACGGAAPGGTSTGPPGTVQASALASPTPSPTPTSTPTTTPRALEVGPQGPLEPGTYVAGSPFLSRVTLSLPPGWFADIGGPYAVFLDPSMDPVSNDDGLVELVIFEKIYADPCHLDQGILSPWPGPSVDDLANALAKVPSLVATAPTDVTVAGYHGKQLTLTSPTSIATPCSVWQLPQGATNTMVPGERDRYWILDIKGQRLVIEAHEVPGESAADKAAVQGILDSIGFAPAT
jgi:hypothetical protein